MGNIFRSEKNINGISCRICHFMKLRMGGARAFFHFNPVRCTAQSMSIAHTSGSSFSVAFGNVSIDDAYSGTY